MMHNFFKTLCPVFIAALALYTHPAAADEKRTSNASIYSMDTSGLIAPGGTLHLISKQFDFTEGPAVDAQGNIFFTDQNRNNIWKWSTDGALSLFLHGTGRANGLYI